MQRVRPIALQLARVTSRPDAQIKPQFAANAINALVIAAHPFDVSETQKRRAKAPATVRVGRPQQPVCDQRVPLDELRLVPAASL